MARPATSVIVALMLSMDGTFAAAPIDLVNPGFEQLPGDGGTPPVSGPPCTLVNPSPPVAVLTGPGTASSGEAVALAFVGRPATRSFGQPTAGLTTGNAPSRLSDGAILNLAVTKMTDRHGTVYGGRIHPDVRIGIDGTPGQDDETVRAAMAWLREAGIGCDD